MERLEWNPTLLTRLAYAILENESNERAAIVLDAENLVRQATNDLIKNPMDEDKKMLLPLLQDRHSAVLARCKQEMKALQRAAEEEILSLSQ
jgi:hypothetical protein